MGCSGALPGGTRQREHGGEGVGSVELGHTEDFSLWLSREATSRLQISSRSVLFAAWQEYCSSNANRADPRLGCFHYRGVLMLRFITSTLTACALASTVSVFAQEPAPAQPETPQVPKETLTGCVIEAKTTAGGTAYVLNNAEGGSAKMYVLAGSSETELATNVNKKVEVIGPVQQPATPPAEDGASANPKVLRPPFVQVESVKVVAENCK
jgi:hypothetical protein